MGTTKYWTNDLGIMTTHYVDRKVNGKKTSGYWFINCNLVHTFNVSTEEKTEAKLTGVGFSSRLDLNILRKKMYSDNFKFEDAMTIGAGLRFTIELNGVKAAGYMNPEDFVKSMLDYDKDQPTPNWKIAKEEISKKSPKQLRNMTKIMLVALSGKDDIAEIGNLTPVERRVWFTRGMPSKF